jgi:hypothetical protein
MLVEPPCISIPCITLWRPWANWVALGWKPIETRLHDRFRSFKGRRIAIHAGQKFDWSAVKAAIPYLDDDRNAKARLLGFPQTAGRIVCTAMVEDARWLDDGDSARALIDCGSVRRFGLVLADVREVPHALSEIVKGRQGPFTVELPEPYVL